MSQFGIQIHAALLGDYEKEIEKGRHAVSMALRVAVDRAGETLQSKLRQDVASSGLARGDKLQKTWRRRMYPRRNVETLGPAVLVYSTMPRIVAAFEQGAEIIVHGKRGALVPNPEVWRGRVKRPAGRGAKAETTFAVAQRAFGKLQFIATPGHDDLAGIYLARVEGGRPAGKRRRAAGVRALGRRVDDRVVVFWVMTGRRLPRLLKGNVIRARAVASAPADIARNYKTALEAAFAGTLRLTGPEDGGTP
jgi:hypothetical protein